MSKQDAQSGIDVKLLPATESLKETLAELAIDSDDLNAASLTEFNVTALTPEDLVGTWLRVGIYSEFGTTEQSMWDVKIDKMTLDFALVAAPVPEPALAGILMLGVLSMQRWGQRRVSRDAQCAKRSHNC